MPKKKDTRTWYQKASRNGARFIDLSVPKNRAKLTPQEEYYLKKQEKWFNYKTAENNKNYYLGLDEAMRENARLFQKNILSGKRYRDMLENYKENYITAMKFNGYDELSRVFKYVWSKLSESERATLTENDAPEIPFFYKIKLKSESKEKENQVEDSTIQGHMEELAEVLERYIVEKNMNLRGIRDEDVKAFVREARKKK